MKYSRKKLAAAFVTLLERHPSKREQVVRVMARELVQQKMAREADVFMNDVARELFVSRQHLEVTLLTAREISQALQDQIGALLREHTHAHTVHVATRRTPAIIGKFIARTPLGDLDASIATQLNHLKEKF